MARAGGRPAGRRGWRLPPPGSEEAREPSAPWGAALATGPRAIRRPRGEGYDLAGAQAVRDDKQEHRVVAPSHGRRAVDAVKEGLDGLPRERTGESLATVDAGGVDPRVEAGWGKAAGREEAQEG